MNDSTLRKRPGAFFGLRFLRRVGSLLLLNTGALGRLVSATQSRFVAGDDVSLVERDLLPYVNRLLLYVNDGMVLPSSLGIFAVFAHGDGFTILRERDSAGARRSVSAVALGSELMR